VAEGRVVRWAAAPPHGDVWTPRAVAGLIGQTPRLTKNFDHRQPSVRTRVIDARIEDDDVVLTLELPPEVSADLGAFVADPLSVAPGYQVRESVPPDAVGGVQRLLEVALREVSDRG
jgi:hypothetical protein